MESKSLPSIATQEPAIRIDWINSAVIVLSPLLAIAGAIYAVRTSGFALVDLGILVAFFILAGMGITVGYHRHFSHLSYEAHPVARFFMLVAGASALQNSALAWASDHRDHHQFTDGPKDPYNINKGFFWAHMGWIFFQPVTPPDFANVKDLKRDPLVMWQHRNYLAIAILSGFVLPTLVGALFGRALEGFVWGGLVRLVLVHHSTFLINSAAHIFGERHHSEATTARDSWWLPFISFGEGYHNYHHSYPSDYRNGVAWHHFDPSKWIIATMEKIGLAWNLRRNRRQRAAA